MNDGVARVKIPAGSSVEDLYSLGLDTPLKEAADLIERQNRALMARVVRRDFKPSEELDASGNNGYANLHNLAEAVVLYPEGWVPYRAAEKCRKTSDALVGRLMLVAGAPIKELDEFRYRLRNFFDGWMGNYTQPRMSDYDYRKRIFRLLGEVTEALIRLHSAYLLSEVSDDAKRRGGKSRKWSRQQVLVFGRIDTLRARKFSVAKAIEHLCNGECSEYMRETGANTWKVRYYAYKRGE